MRFNQKELAFIATRTDIPFDKEGVLWMKEKEGHFWQRNEGNDYQKLLRAIYISHISYLRFIRNSQ